MRILLILACLTLPLLGSCQYQPNWDSIDSRPLPAWYDDAKFGIFMHWGVYSVPSFFSEWFWDRWQGDPPYPSVVNFMKENFRPGFTYADFGPMFTAEFFDPNAWADILEASGANYVVLTSKHHEGFTMWPSNASWNWNAKDIGPKRDLVGELAAAVRSRTKIHFGLYFSLFEWFHPLFLYDKANGFQTREYRNQIMMPQIMDIVNSYKPDIVWADGANAPDSYWNSTEFLAWLYNESPVKDQVVVNDRWCKSGCLCKHGGYFTCNDRYDPGKLQNHKWENAMTVDMSSWGYVRTTPLSGIFDIHGLIQKLVRTISCGGNLLLNVGPTHDGRIVPIFEERLRQMGSWLKVNGEGVYGSIPWRKQNDTVNPDVWYTTTKKSDAVYAFLLKWPQNNTVYIDAPVAEQNTNVTMLGYGQPLKWEMGPAYQGMNIMLPFLNPSQTTCRWAWVLKLRNVF
ncbi:alpha-L-fucosidase [Strongylocentrotus purpuratus]|uniref:alpha-L-fucosidase n=1 Tax=Strongylocentrotus purpuratus TaxID=7668 RepID=A0A7M7NQN7_STRPU|nr:alpha-L-fucosidase [Strongylocentrotus purpuratus]